MDTLDQLDAWEQRINVGFNPKCSNGPNAQAIPGLSAFELLSRVAAPRSLDEHNAFCLRHGLGQAVKIVH